MNTKTIRIEHVRFPASKDTLAVLKRHVNRRPRQFCDTHVYTRAVRPPRLAEG